MDPNQAIEMISDVSRNFYTVYLCLQYIVVITVLCESLIRWSLWILVYEIFIPWISFEDFLHQNLIPPYQYYCEVINTLLEMAR